MREELRKAVLSRELSWLDFNKRVLEQAQDDSVPLMERLRFLAIYDSNLDEFYRTRAGKLLTLSLSDNGIKDPRTGMHPSEQLKLISKRTLEEIPLRDSVFLQLEKQLENYGIHRLTPAEIFGAAYDKTLTEIFRSKILPDISPRIILSDDERPVLKNGSVYAAFYLEDISARAIGLVDCSHLPALTEIPSKDNGGFFYIPTCELVMLFPQEIFRGRQITETTALRITRSAFIDLSEAYSDTNDTIAKMSEIMDKRERLTAVRVQLSKHISPIFCYFLLERLGADDAEIFIQNTPLTPSLFHELNSRMSKHTELYYKRFTPCRPRSLMPGESLEEAVKKRDILLSYPYESMEPFLRMLEDAASDPMVSSVKMTLYRLSHNSRIADALCKAAAAGKEVFVCIELRARFSETDNIFYANKLRSYGCNVVYGLPDLKVHCKLCRIDMLSDGRLYRITQIGTGNYNETTSEQYTDLSLVTTDEIIANDADLVFSSLKVMQPPPPTERLMTSPKALRAGILSMLDNEISIARAGGNGYFGAKLNGLSDPVIMSKLSEASCAGVKIELLIRGICCLTAGAAGLYENITVHSLVGRYLEHARIYIFGTENRREVYISSADLMTRNTVRRVEAAVKITDSNIAERIVGYFNTQMSDSANARIMQPDGKYIRAGERGTDSQQMFADEAEKSEISVKYELAKKESERDLPAVTAVDNREEHDLPKKKSIWQRIRDFFHRRKK